MLDYTDATGFRFLQNCHNFWEIFELFLLLKLMRYTLWVYISIPAAAFSVVKPFFDHWSPNLFNHLGPLQQNPLLIRGKGSVPRQAYLQDLTCCLYVSIALNLSWFGSSSFYLKTFHLDAGCPCSTIVSYL